MDLLRNDSNLEAELQRVLIPQSLYFVRKITAAYTKKHMNRRIDPIFPYHMPHYLTGWHNRLNKQDQST